MHGFAFWYFVFPFAVGIPLIILLGIFVQYVTAREKKYPEFAKKMDKFRTFVEKYWLTKKQRETIGIIVVISLFILYLYYK